MNLKLTNLAVVVLVSMVLSGCLEDNPTNIGDDNGGGTPPTIVTLSIGDGTVTEGDSGSSSVVFTVSIDASTSDDVTFQYATADGTATAGSDYTAASGSTTISAGSTSADISVSVLGDTDVEDRETFSMTLSNPSSNAQLGDAMAVMEIIDNDQVAPTVVTLSIGDGSVTEGDSGTSSVVFTVSIDTSASEDVTFEFATADGTATAGSDYTAASGSGTVSMGSTSTDIAVSILGDTVVEDLETFSVTLSNPSSNAQLGDAVAVMEIIDNDQATPVTGAFPGVPEYSFRDQLPDLGDPADVTSCSENGTTVNGTPDNWVVVTLNQNSGCTISGSYYVIQNSTINDRLAPSGGPYAIRNTEIDSPGTGGALVPSGTDILVESNTIRDNGVIPSDPDHHGMNVRGNVERLWILSNLIYQNSGDAIQFCHGCIGGVHDGPAYVYIAGNVMHDDEENAIDLKEFLGPVVAVCNEMYGYERGTFSGNGEAVRINDEGQQGQVWFAHNNYHDNLRDLAPYSSDAEGYFLDENTTSVNNSNSNSIIVNGAAAQPYYDQYQAQYGLDLSADCPTP